MGLRDYGKRLYKFRVRVMLCVCFLHSFDLKNDEKKNRIQNVGSIKRYYKQTQ